MEEKNESKHTPGWEIDISYKRDDLHFTVVTCNENPVATATGHNKRIALERAELIASAPALLEENERLSKRLSFLGGEDAIKNALALRAKVDRLTEENEKLKNQDWTLSRKKMPDFDGSYLVAGFINTECGNTYEFQRVAECRLNQWVKNDVGEQMTLWRPLLPFPKLEKYSDHEKH